MEGRDGGRGEEERVLGDGLEDGGGHVAGKSSFRHSSVSSLPPSLRGIVLDDEDLPFSLELEVVVHLNLLILCDLLHRCHASDQGESLEAVVRRDSFARNPGAIRELH